MVTRAKRPSDSTESADSIEKRPRLTDTPTNPKLKFKSPAEFFAENKNIAGFDNPGKSLYTTIRELVENGLDAAESVRRLPEIQISVQRIGKEQFKREVGMDKGRERVDSSLYKDVETDKEKKKREAKEKREAKKKMAKDRNLNPLVVDDPASMEEPSQPTQPSTKKERLGGNEIFRVIVSDNGSGMPHNDVPNMMGRVLAGTKYSVRQARGKFGLGSKMALIWSKMSTGLPVHVVTAKKGNRITECLLDIDIAKNIPNIIEHSLNKNEQGWSGTKVSVTIEGNWTTYRAKILSYVRQMAVITPYAQFRLKFISSVQNADNKDFELVFARRTDQMPREAVEVKHHPSSVNQLLLKQLIGEVPASMTLLSFLTTQFVAITTDLAARLINELGPDFTEHMTVDELNLNHVRQIDALLHEARFETPNGACLSPAGEYNLRLGITKELKPSMVATHAEPPDVFEGHPFIVEVGVALGGVGLKPGLNIFRFANRIPLLFEAGNDVVTKTVRESIRWSSYKISPTTDRIGVICSIVSTKIPFKGTGKEYIGDDADSIKACVKRAIMQCCVQLRAKLVRQAAQKEAAHRKLLMARYAPDIANAIVAMFEDLDDADATTKDIWEQVKSGKVGRKTLEDKLVEHVQQVDKEQAIEYATATGRDQKTLETMYISSRSDENDYTYVSSTHTKRKATLSGESGPPSTEVLKFALLSSLQSTL